MVLPVSVDYEYQDRPWATFGLLAANIVMYVLTLSIDISEITPLVLQTHDFALHQLLTSSFLHIGLLHLLGNMIFLAVFGRFVEARIGWWRYLLLYAACAVAGDLAFLIESIGYDEPRAAIGASGAIAGLMGTTIVVSPRAEVRLYWPHHAPDGFPAVSAWFILGGWMIWQLLLFGFAGPYLSTAFSAHFGGFLAGVGLGFLMRSRWAEGTPWYVEKAYAGGSYREKRQAFKAQMWKATADELRAMHKAESTRPGGAGGHIATEEDLEPIDWPSADEDLR